MLILTTLLSHTPPLSLPLSLSRSLSLSLQGKSKGVKIKPENLRAVANGASEESVGALDTLEQALVKGGHDKHVTKHTEQHAPPAFTGQVLER